MLTVNRFQTKQLNPERKHNVIHMISKELQLNISGKSQSFSFLPSKILIHISHEICFASVVKS